MDCATDGLIHRRLVVRHDDGLAAIAARFDLAALVVVPGFVADRVAEMHIHPPDAVAETVQRSLDDGLHLVRKLLAALNITVCSDFDQHRRLRHFIV
jgi:hypothetical protein